MAQGRVVGSQRPQARYNKPKPLRGGPLFVGVLVFLIGVALCIWLLSVGGIEQIVTGASAHPADGSDIAWGIVRTVCTGLGLVISFCVAAFVAALVNKE